MAQVHLSEPKKKAQAGHAAILFEDEASFRQDSTLHQTWARIGHQPLIPVTGQRNSIKVFGAVDLYEARFHFRRDTVFNAKTYLGFLHQLARSYLPRKVALIQDNASYHKDRQVWEWFKENRHWLEVYNLPPYAPELNATERLWHHTRVNGTHNRYFASQDELQNTLTRVFRSIQARPSQIQGYLAPFL